MRDLSCKHCGSKVMANDGNCSGCGMPLAPDHAKSSQKKFVIFFIAIVLLSIVMMILLPLFD